MTPGTRGPPDRSHSTWGDAELSWAEMPLGVAVQGATAHGEAAAERDCRVYLATTSSWTRSKASLTTLRGGLDEVTHALVFRSSDFCSSLP